MASPIPLGILIIIFFGIILLFNMIKVLLEYERGVIFRLGRLIGLKSPGLIILIPGIDKMVRVDLRVITYDIRPRMSSPVTTSRSKSTPCCISRWSTPTRRLSR